MLICVSVKCNGKNEKKYRRGRLVWNLFARGGGGNQYMCARNDIPRRKTSTTDEHREYIF